ncbi:MAG: ATP-grasp domain-containing protein [Candidatus Firestonebacteria bacterium]
MKKIIVVYYDTKHTKYEFEKERISDTSTIKTANEIAKILNAKTLSLSGNINKDINLIQKIKPDIIFNLVEDYNSLSQNEYRFVSALELLDFKFTGNNSNSLMICLDKSLCKQILISEKINTPRFKLFKKNDEINFKYFPCIVKPNFSDASRGISNESIIFNLNDLRSQVKFILEKYKQNVLVEEFIRGKELHVSILEGKILNIGEIDFKDIKDDYRKIISYDAKWITESFEFKNTVSIIPAKIGNKTKKRVEIFALKCYEVLKLNSYARIDMRLKNNKMYVIDINPNPDISRNDYFALAAFSKGISYEDLIYKISNFT